MPPQIYSRALAGIIVGWSALTTAAQTNSLPQDMQWFVLTAPHLRPESTEPAKSIALPPDVGLEASWAKPASKIELPGSFSVGAGREVTDFYVRHRDFGLIQPPQAPLPHDVISRGFDSVLRPEEFHLGRSATISCSVSTAIKRRNPLCLLNPIFLHISW